MVRITVLRLGFSVRRSLACLHEILGVRPLERQRMATSGLNCLLHSVMSSVVSVLPAK